MKPWQARVLVEKTELAQRIENLRQFLSSTSNIETPDSFEIRQLNKQLWYMVGYLEILKIRLRYFK